jgi:hypothetical protein
MTPERIPVRRAVEGAILAIEMPMMTARVRRTRRALRKGPGKGRKQRTGRGKGRETVNGKVLLNEPQGEMISLVPLFCSCRSKCQRQTWTRRVN